MQLLIQSLIYILLFSLTITCASAESEWDSIRFAGLPGGRTYNVSMGSGFFVNRNYILTNRHVVTNCKNIAIRGAISPKLVKLAVLDEDVDLALLYSESEPKNIPYLRINYDQIAKNDVLFTVGYPLEHGENGDFVIREAKVIEVTKNPNNGFSNITFSDVINHGNSGGPVLDKNSNVSGVVVAKITYYEDAERTKQSRSIGVSIGLDGLIDFLRKNNIFFAANTTYDVFTNYKIDNIVKDYVVNIHCVSDVMSPATNQ